MKKNLITLIILLAVSLVWLSFDAGIMPKKHSTHQNYSWLKEGDVVFQDMDGDFGKAIKLATHSKFSHCGIILKNGNELMVFEAVGPVKYTPIKEWVMHGKNKAFTVKRLQKATSLSSKALETCRKNTILYAGKAYDHVFGWSDEKLYCSELVWKIYKNSLGIELSSPKKLKDFDLSNSLVKQQLALRYGEKIPYEEKVVSPQDIYDSKLLVEVKN